MSYTALVPIKRGYGSDAVIAFRNSWGGAARIWNALWDRYLKDPKIQYHTWITEAGNTDCALWKLHDRADLTPAERAVHLFTYDLAYVARENFKRFAADLRVFDARYPAAGTVNHLPAFADVFEQAKYGALGLHGTSAADLPWRCKKNDGRLPNIRRGDGAEVYGVLKP